MFIIDSYITAVVFSFITMICWGSWANTQKLAEGNWRFELFYWDYVLGILFVSLLLALTMGSFGIGGRGFFEDLQQTDLQYLSLALLGGTIFNAANILLCAAIAIAGMSVAFPVGIGIALVLGVLVNYLENPIGNPSLLFMGVGFIVLAILLNAFAYRRASSTSERGVSTKGLIISGVAGLLMGFFYKYVAASMFTDFAVPEAGKLSPYSAVFCFSLGILVSNILFNTILMKKPFTGSPVTYTDYFKGSFRNHLIGILGGSIWGVGMSFSILASDKAGPAISYGLGQGATVIAAIWGIVIWKEFKNAPKGTALILNSMLLFYLVGLGFIIAAR